MLPGNLFLLRLFTRLLPFVLLFAVSPPQRQRATLVSHRCVGVPTLRPFSAPEARHALRVVAWHADRVLLLSAGGASEVSPARKGWELWLENVRAP